VDDFYWLDQIQLSDRPFVGDKAFHLSQLAQQGYPVVSGLVISAKGFRQFLETIHWLEPLFADLPSSSLHFDANNARQLQAIAQQIRQTIQATALPVNWLKPIEMVAQTFPSAPLILRPSLGLYPSPKNESTKQAGIVSGLLDAQICWSEPEAIVQGLKQLWAELFRARSLFYWQSYGIELQQIHLAVLVQPLMPAMVSGSVQTSRTTFEVQSTWGLGLALKQGEVIPDLHQICARNGNIQTQRLGSKMLAYQTIDSATETTPSFPSSTFEPRAEATGHKSSEQLEPTPLTTYTTLVAITNSCLQPYLPSEEQQQQFALRHDQLQALTQLMQRLVSELGSSLSVEWVIAQHGEHNRFKVYLTQVQLRSSLMPSVQEIYPQHSDSDTEVVALQQKILSGIAAAAGRAIAKAQVLTTVDSSIEVIPGSILVAPTVTPDWLPWLKHAVGVIAEQGGMTSHSAIIARELGIPAVVGATNATQLLQTGENILLNGDRGEVFRVGYSKNSSHKEDSGSGKIRSKDTIEPLASLPTSHAVPIHDSKMIATQLMVNLSQPEVLEQITQLPVDGVGLLRSELLLLTVLKQEHPHLWLRQGRRVELVSRLAEQIQLFADAFSPKPVFYRSLDLRSHEFRDSAYPAVDAATNPMLGLRGTLSYQHYPELFDAELEALAQVQANFGNIHLILPFVRTVEEFQFCQKRVSQAGLQNPHFQLWIMAEVPSVLFLLPQFVAAGVQGISIGTNDLTQLLLGVDRDYPPLAKSFDERHPAVLQAIAHLIQLAQKYDIPCSICGEASARYPELVERLVEWGITSISVDPNAVETTYRSIARAEQRLLLRSVRQPPLSDRTSLTGGLL
jgi:pyruvate, water dikinase